MLTAAIPFPDISHELFSIEIGSFTFALRWYALAYIAGLLIGWRLPIGGRLRADIRYAIGGMLAATFCLFSFSYSAWNEAFWSTLALAVAALVLLSRRVRGSLG